MKIAPKGLFALEIPYTLLKSKKNQEIFKKSFKNSKIFGNFSEILKLVQSIKCTISCDILKNLCNSSEGVFKNQVNTVETEEP